MKIGLSLYSLHAAISAGALSLADGVRWIADNGGEHLEVVSFMGDFTGNPRAVEELGEAAEKAGIAISAYCTGVDFLRGGKEEIHREAEAACRHIDIARKMGAGIVRCDLTAWMRDPAQRSMEHFEHNLPLLANGARLLADYAAPLGLVVTVENHGMFINGADRMRRLLTAVDRPNYRCTLDVGNSLCVDENPLVALDELLPFAQTVHFKDFYIRRDKELIGEGPWIKTPRLNYLRGAIVGHGDMDTALLTEELRRRGYDGWVAVEFEGMEDCRVASRTGMDNLRRLLAR